MPIAVPSTTVLITIELENRTSFLLLVRGERADSGSIVIGSPDQFPKSPRIPSVRPCMYSGITSQLKIYQAPYEDAKPRFNRAVEAEKKGFKEGELELNASIDRPHSTRQICVQHETPA